MSNDAYIQDDEASYIQQQQENDAYEYWVYYCEQKEYREYLEVLAKGDEHVRDIR